MDGFWEWRNDIAGKVSYKFAFYFYIVAASYFVDMGDPSIQLLPHE